MTTQILIAKKGDKLEVLGIEQGSDTLKAEFKNIVLAEGKGYEALELIDSRSGRIKRKSFAVVAEEPKVKKEKK
jgi:hypothetical protein